MLFSFTLRALSSSSFLCIWLLEFAFACCIYLFVPFEEKLDFSARWVVIFFHNFSPVSPIGCWVTSPCFLPIANGKNLRYLHWNASLFKTNQYIRIINLPQQICIENLRFFKQKRLPCMLLWSCARVLQEIPLLIEQFSLLLHCLWLKISNSPSAVDLSELTILTVWLCA